MSIERIIGFVGAVCGILALPIGGSYLGESVLKAVSFPEQVPISILLLVIAVFLILFALVLRNQAKLPYTDQREYVSKLEEDLDGKISSLDAKEEELNNLRALYNELLDTTNSEKEQLKLKIDGALLGGSQSLKQIIEILKIEEGSNEYSLLLQSLSEMATQDLIVASAGYYRKN
ncbi:hypothetical protein AB0539_004653 [Vibrio parahaemolyticus]|uniref:hypothetical protein n=1 Tax=Vibrio parahaemolyticus TaxID=670 RepID=UPI00248B32CE|nr:hypothetical protein [Vibrio parahaemolyticus]